MFEKLTTEELQFKKHPLHTMLLGWEFHAKPVFFFNIFSGDLHFDAFL